MPIACWTLVPLCDAGAIGLSSPFLWQVAAMAAAIGLASGAAAASAGALDYAKAQSVAPRLVAWHGLLMTGALLLATLSLIGRLGPGYVAKAPAPLWAIAAGTAAFLVMVVGAWCGGEMVYGRGIGIRATTLPADASASAPSPPDPARSGG